MALIRFSDTNRQQLPTLSASMNNARIGINKALLMLLNLKIGDFIAFYQNSEDPTEWWVKKEDNGLQVRSNTEGSTFVKCPIVADNMLRLSTANVTIKILVSTQKNDQGMFLIVTSSINKITHQKNG